MTTLAKQLLDIYDTNNKEINILISRYNSQLTRKPKDTRGFFEWLRQEIAYPRGEIYKANYPEDK